MLEAVQDQLTSPETPEVQLHHRRLKSLGLSDIRARELIGILLVAYLNRLVRGDNYTYADYVATLERLPEIDFGDD